MLIIKSFWITFIKMRRGGKGTSMSSITKWLLIPMPLKINTCKKIKTSRKLRYISIDTLMMQTHLIKKMKSCMVIKLIELVNLTKKLIFQIRNSYRIWCNYKNQLCRPKRRLAKSRLLNIRFKKNRLKTKF